MEVQRGSYGACQLSVFPSQSLDSVLVWTFVGENSSATYAQNTTQWGGTLVDPGEVLVEFIAGGRLGSVRSVINIVPRTSGIWSSGYWASQLDYSQGMLPTNCVPSFRPAVGVVLGAVGAYPDPGVPTCAGQRINPTTGYTRAKGSGPSENAWYVPSAPWGFHSASTLNAAVEPGFPGSVLSDPVQATQCRTALGLPPGSPVNINFWHYNSACRLVSGWSGFIPSLWEHEREHFEQAESSLLIPEHDMYRSIEDIIRGSEFDLSTAITSQYNHVQSVATGAAGVEPTGNWFGDYWVWYSQVTHFFVQATGNH